MLKDAIMSEPNASFRYVLWRIWDERLPRALFIGLNPSTADAETDDNTIRKCIQFATNWGMGGIYMLNLFAARSTDPKGLHDVKDPIGPDCNHWIDFYTMKNSGPIICAWGAGVEKSPIPQRDQHVLNRIKDQHKLYNLGLTKAGHPRHPLYIPYKDKAGNLTRPKYWEVE